MRVFCEDLLVAVVCRQVYATFDWESRRRGITLFWSRTDDVINIAGHRLGTREIEENISSYPNVAEVAVVGIKTL